MNKDQPVPILKVRDLKEFLKDIPDDDDVLFDEGESLVNLTVRTAGVDDRPGQGRLPGIVFESLGE